MSVATSTAHASGLEVAEGASAGALALVAVDDRRPDAGALEMFADAVRAALRLAEDERLTAGACVRTCVSSVVLAIEVDGMDAMGHRGRDRLLVRHVHRRGSRVNSVARRMTSAESVAEKSSVWRVAATPSECGEAAAGSPCRACGRLRRA